MKTHECNYLNRLDIGYNVDPYVTILNNIMKSIEKIEKAGKDDYVHPPIEIDSGNDNVVFYTDTAIAVKSYLNIGVFTNLGVATDIAIAYKLVAVIIFTAVVSLSPFVA